MKKSSETPVFAWSTCPALSISAVRSLEYFAPSPGAAGGEGGDALEPEGRPPGGDARSAGRPHHGASLAIRRRSVGGVRLAVVRGPRGPIGLTRIGRPGVLARIRPRAPAAAGGPARVVARA